MTNQLAEAKSQLGLKSGLKKERSASFVMSMATYDTKRDPPIVFTQEVHEGGREVAEKQFHDFFFSDFFGDKMWR